MRVYDLKEKLQFLQEVVTLEHNEWAANPTEDFENKIKMKCEKVRNLLDSDDFCKLILLDNDILIGFISIFPHDCDQLPDLTPWYATMYVKKEFRGKGYSKILNDAVLKEAKKRGYKEIYLKTDLNNYYEKFGAVFIKMIIPGKNKGSVLLQPDAVGMAVADIRNIRPGGNVRRGVSGNSRGHDGAVLFQAQDPVRSDGHLPDALPARGQHGQLFGRGKHRPVLPDSREGGHVFPVHTSIEHFSAKGAAGHVDAGHVRP